MFLEPDLRFDPVGYESVVTAGLLIRPRPEGLCWATGIFKAFATKYELVGPLLLYLSFFEEIEAYRALHVEHTLEVWPPAPWWTPEDTVGRKLTVPLVTGEAYETVRESASSINTGWDPEDWAEFTWAVRTRLSEALLAGNVVPWHTPARRRGVLRPPML